MGINCPKCKTTQFSIEGRRTIVAAGFFNRKCDLSRQQRFLCKPCKKTFSLATYSLCYWQKKRQLNPIIYKGFVSGLSQRRMALLLSVNRKTIVRKFIFLGLLSHHLLLETRLNYPLATEVEFDDLETFEHSKLKPLSVVMMVESHTRRILGYRVARMSAKGLLVEKSHKKYGKRKDERRIKREELFQELHTYIDEFAVIKSDDNPHYPQTLKKFFKKALHKTYKGRRGCVVGQGELKSGGFDPIFSLNHSFAMLRANINRLFRRTWNTTKKIERLDLHIAMYALYHNEFLLK